MKTTAKSIMGCSWGGHRRTVTHPASTIGKGDGGGGVGPGIKLATTGASFSRNQLAALNRHLGDLLATTSMQTEHRLPPSRSVATLTLAPNGHSLPTGHQRDIGDIVERLVQRLICGVGILDKRFSSKYLVKLHEDYGHHFEKTESEKCYEYLVRLDTLSSPGVGSAEDSHVICHMLEGDVGADTPQGFARLTVQGEGSADWGEFVSLSGFLRRDKIQERFVELLALSAGGASPSRPSEVDEAWLCGAPGKVVDAGVLDEILKIPSDEHVYYGSVGNDEERFPDPRDFRLAIVEEPAGVRLRIGFLSPTILQKYGSDDVEVHMVLGIGFDGWPAASDYSERIELSHPDLLMYYQAAQTAMYSVGVAPSPMLNSEERSTLWKLSFPAARITIRTHYGPGSVPNLVLDVLNAILHRLNHLHGQEKLKIVNRNVLLTLLLFELEKSYSTPSFLYLSWTPDSLSQHILVILENLSKSLRKQFQRSYFFPNQNVFLTSASLCKTDFSSDADKIYMYIEHLHEESTLGQRFDHETWTIARVQTALINKWVSVMSDLSPPPITRSRRLGFSVSDEDTVLSAASTQFTKKQLDYLDALFKTILKAREITSGNPYIFLDNDELLYLVNFILDQALKHSLSMKKQSESNIKSSSKYNANKLKNGFEHSKKCLFDAIRSDLRKSKVEFKSDDVLTRHVLKWLYRALDEDKKFLAPVLRPYLNQLFVSSYENSWHYEAWKRREGYVDEMKTLGTFCKLVNEGAIKPVLGIIDTANKGWFWAQDITDMMREYDELKIILTPEDCSTLRYDITMGSSKRTKFQTLWKNDLRYIGRNMMTSTLPAKKNGDYEGDIHFLTHSDIRDASPMTRSLDSRRRYGQHRGLGDLMEALVALNKFSILQEISTILPDAERLHMLDTIHRISKGTRRRHIRTLRHRSQSQPRVESTTIVSDVTVPSTDRNDHKEHHSSKKKHATVASRTKKQQYTTQTYRPISESFLFRSDRNVPSNAQKILDQREKQVEAEIEKMKYDKNSQRKKVDNVVMSNKLLVAKHDSFRKNFDKESDVKMYKKVFEISPMMMRGQKYPRNDDYINRNIVDVDDEVFEDTGVATVNDYRKTFGKKQKGNKDIITKF